MASAPDSNKNYFMFAWKITNFSMCIQRRREFFRSPTFIAESLDNTQWFVDLYPKGSQSADEGYMSCFLQRENDGQQVDIQLDFRFELIGANGETLFAATSSRPRDFKKGSQWGWCNFKKIQFITDKANNFLPNDVLTIHCYMVESMPKTTPANSCFACSEISVDRFSFKWRIEQFSSPMDDHKKLFHSGNSLIELASGLEENDVKITITRNSGNNLSPSFMKCRITLLDVNGFQDESHQSEHFFDKDGIWKFPDFLKKSQLLAAKNKYLKDDILTLRCEFSISDGTVSSEIEEYKHSDNPISLENPVSIESLKVDLKNMYSNNILTDIKLKCGSETFQSHKCLLSARSPVFYAMFSHDMEENHSGVVEIVDLGPNTLNAMLLFMYTGFIEEKDYESVSKLMVAADKYQVASLKEECAIFLQSILSESNVCDVLLLGDMVHHEALKTSAVDYIKSNWKKILHSSHWKQFIESNVKVATETLCQLSLGVSD